MADHRDPCAAIRSGLPDPARAPFLLDPGYQALLDSDAFRRRFADQHLSFSDELFYGGGALLLLCAGLSFPVLYLATGLNEFMIPTINISLMLIPLGLFFSFKRLRCFLKYLRLRRLTWHGRLVTGTVLIARRVREKAKDPEDGSIVVVEIEYRADLPDGTRIQGRKARERDDLLNAELPEPGTPVVVLVHGTTTHAVL